MWCWPVLLCVACVPTKHPDLPMAGKGGDVLCTTSVPQHTLTPLLLWGSPLSPAGAVRYGGDLVGARGALQPGRPAGEAGGPGGGLPSMRWSGGRF